MHDQRKRVRPSSANVHGPGVGEGTFLNESLSTGAGSRAYKLYVPRGYSRSTPTPLLVALHGCTQDAANFAAGTRFNLLADTHNFLVLYPEQSATSHPNKCWTWYHPHNQVRGSGEPALLAALVDSIKSKYTIDSNRVFITGMSAGAAMAVIVAVCYPDYFAAVGVHSGLEYKAASDLSNAHMAMMQGGPDPVLQGKLAYQSAGSAARVLPVIVFHGKSDTTVHPINGDQVIQQFAKTAAYADNSITNNANKAIPSSTHRSQVPNGHSYTVYNYENKGQVLLQKYLIDNMGHAWSGGNKMPPATFTDPKGPDASTLMWNFFASHPKVASTSTFTSRTTTRPRSQESDDIIEGVFRFVDEPMPSKSSSTTATLTPTVVISSSKRSSAQAVTVTLSAIANESGYVMNNFPYPGDLSAGILASTPQYGIVSFDTSHIPANATLESVTLKITRNYASAGNAYGKLGSLVADIKGGSGFSGSPALQGTDGTASADANTVCTMSLASVPGVTAQGNVAPSAFRYINRVGRTQLRFRFTVASVNSYGTDYVGFCGGEMRNIEGNRPLMVITYRE